MLFRSARHREECHHRDGAAGRRRPSGDGADDALHRARRGQHVARDDHQRHLHRERNEFPEAATPRVGVVLNVPLPAAPIIEQSAIEPLLPVNPTLTPEDRAASNMVDNAVTGGADLAAGSIGVVADYLADQMGEMFAPTPPEVREAQAKAIEKARAEAPAPEPVNPYLKHAGVADNKAQQDREDKERDDYWDDKERRRER